MNNIEIPLKTEKTLHYRLFEILPGVLTWTVLTAPFWLSMISARITALLIIAFFLVWFTRALAMNIRVLQGYSAMKKSEKYDWPLMLQELENLPTTLDVQRSVPKWHQANIDRVRSSENRLKPSDLIHAVIIATYNESRETLEPTIKAVLDSHIDHKNTVLVIAFEERGGVEVERQAKDLIKDYQNYFMHAFACKHPDGLLHEVRGKGGNITFAGRELARWVEQKGIDPLNVVVTTLDSDNRPHPNYLPALSYTYCLTPDPMYKSFQPIPIFTNNIWDAPAPMRVIATGNSFWMVIQALRPHILRNFAAHAQSLAALIKTDFWSTRTIVEDGHQFWRTYFRLDGKHEVYPIFLPIYQDAVLSTTYRKTLVAQFVQLRRWAWGASDIAYVADKAFFQKNNIKFGDKMAKFLRLLEGHLSWATAPLILLFAAFIPLIFNPQDYTANQLPIIASYIQRLAMLGIVITLFLSIKSLPPKPARYKKRRSLWMLLQWVYLPITGIFYSASAAIYSQTRLMLGKYLDKFDVTEKAVKTDTGTVGGHQVTK